MKKYIWLLVIWLIMGNAKKAYIDTTYDEFEDYTRIGIYDNLLGCDYRTNNKIWLSLFLFIDENKDTTLYLTLFYRGDDWVFIREGKSMIMLVDDERLIFESVYSDRDASGKGVSEKNIYESDNLIDDIQKIAYADSVKIKIIGSKLYMLRHFKKENFEIFQKFIEEVLQIPQPDDSLRLKD